MSDKDVFRAEMDERRTHVRAYRVSFGIVAMGVLALIVVLIVGLKANGKHHEQCFELGGHIGPKNLCLTSDGRVIEP